MEISSVTQHRGKWRIAVGNEIFVVSSAIFHERPLHEGEDIDPDEYDHWLMVRQFRSALDYAVSLLAARPYAEKELEGKIIRNGYRPATAEMVVIKLKKYDLLDDAAFASQWAESRSHRLLGPNRIRQELRRKGVTTEIAEEAVSLLSEDAMSDNAEALVKKVLRRSISLEDPKKRAQRTIAALVRRGYTFDAAKAAVYRVMQEISEQEK